MKKIERELKEERKKGVKNILSRGEKERKVKRMRVRVRKRKRKRRREKESPPSP